MTERLYIITRADLSPGQQAVQACHAAAEFLTNHVEISSVWRSNSNTLALLAVANESELAGLAEQAHAHGIKHSTFHEPDRGMELTAIALEPNARCMVKRLKLALTD